MANRAYLYPADDPAGWFHTAWPDHYYDSRWTMPLAWFFFYRPADVLLIEHPSGGYREVKFSAEKAPALDLFTRRRPLLSAVLGGLLGEAAIDFFAAKQAARPGRYLILDPGEVISDDDYDTAVRYRHVLTLLGDGAGTAGPAAPARAALLRETGELAEFGRDRLECQLIGYTYGDG